MKKRTWITSSVACAVAIATTSTVTPITLAQSPAATATQPAATPSVGLDGYCAVCVVMMKKWEKGNPAITSTYDNTVYYFPSAAIKAKFDAKPEAFVPAFGGDCIVCYEKMKKRVPGKVEFASLHNDRLYLFPSEAEKKMFEAEANRFNDTDLAAGGDCIVCYAKMGKQVPGSTDHTVIHNGMRYLFPSNAEADMFRQSPADWVAKAANRSKTGMKQNASGDNAVMLVGRSGCAGCEHGVKPLGTPDELGLAINTKDGQVIVVEEAHKLYPEAYKARFDGGNMEVRGKVVKTQGKVSWVQPTSLKAVK